MDNRCEFQRFDLEGNVVYRCDSTECQLRLIPGQTQYMWLACDDHYFWAPDPKWWKPLVDSAQ